MDSCSLSCLSRFSSLRWEKFGTLPETLEQCVQSVLLNDRLYVAGTSKDVLYSCSINSKNLVWAKTYSHKGVYQFTLSSYRSKLVTIGGLKSVDTENFVTNNVYVLEDDNMDWKEGYIPPMIKERYAASAVSTSKCLFVVGGYEEFHIQLEQNPDHHSNVEIYDGQNWTLVDHLPFVCTSMKSVVHKGHCYVVGGDSAQERSQKWVYHASLQSFEEATNEADFKSIWHKLTAIPLISSSLVILDGTLVSIGKVVEEMSGIPQNVDDPSYHSKPSSDFYAYVPRSSSWKLIENGNLPVTLKFPSFVALPANEMLIIGSKYNYSNQDYPNYECPNEIYKANIQVCHSVNSKSFTDSLIQEELGSVKTELRLAVSNAILQREHREKLIVEIETLKSILTKDATSPLPHQILADSQELRGVDVCAETTLIVTSTSTVHWKGYGLTLHFPDGCLPAGMDQCTITIMASLAGQYEFPMGSHLVSAVYWLRCEPRCKFVKKVSVEIEHCALKENIHRLRIVKSHCTQENLPYKFKEIHGHFFDHNSYGYVEVDSFSGLGITQNLSEERQYCARLYYLEKSRLNTEIHFVIHWDIELHNTHIQRYYKKEEEAVSGPHTAVSFEAEDISLNIPQAPGMVVSGGWKLYSLATSVVTKKQVDSFRPKRRIPSCQIQALHPPSSSAADQLPVLTHKLQLEGARKPFDTLTISFIPNSLREKPESRPDNPQLKDLFKELNRVASKWENIGTLLGVDVREMATVKANEPDVQNRLREMLKLWLEMDSPPPSWKAVVEAIESLGTEATLARELRQKYI